MKQPNRNRPLLREISRLRSWFAWNLGVNLARKEEVYLDILRAVTLTDTSYWLQVLFAAGIATLGLVLNSPAVIIGAMLISPLMGSILANGLALAAGDVILAMRAIVNLFLSCVVAIGFAVLLVSLLPFKEMTSEILARTQPNLLDLGVALFSGAVGAVAICKQAKGVATSIPGVSIAVALMPPLCVVGYGLGIAIDVNTTTGLQIARGGGLLFFTNFVAITFTAMLVFLALNIDAEPLQDRIREWRELDPQSNWFRSLLDKVPASNRLKKIGSLPGRLVIILTTMLLISIPLNQSFTQLRSEVIYKQYENRLRAAATEVWQKDFATLADGQSRSYINQLSFQERGNNLIIQLRVFTSKLYTEAERAKYKQLLALKLLRPLESLSLNLVEIPTATNDLLRPIPTVTALQEPLPSNQSNLFQEIEAVITDLQLPAPAQRVRYTTVYTPDRPLQLAIVYLSDRDIDRDGQVLLKQNIRTQLDLPTAVVTLERIAPLTATIAFAPNAAILTPAQTQELVPIVKLLQQYAKIGLTVVVNRTPEEILPEIARSQAIASYLQTQGIAAERLQITTATATAPSALLKTVFVAKPDITESNQPVILPSTQPLEVE